MGDAEANTESAIMDATYRAVCSHGYADLTMQDIADEFEKSKSLLHYHYDTKEDLLVAFLEHLIARFEDHLEELTSTDDPPENRLKDYIEGFSVDPEETERTSLHLALLEMRSQAQRNERFRQQFVRSDRMAREAFQRLIEEGQASGRFDHGIDAEALAQLLFASMDGARARQITLGEDGYAEEVAATLYETVIEPLLIEDR